MHKQFRLLILLLVISTPLSAQWFGLSTPGIPRSADGSLDMSAPAPKGADGHSDMSGLWVPSGATGSLFDTSKIQGWALDAMAENKTKFFVDDPRFHCLPSGPGSYTAGMIFGGIRRIVQHPDIIAVLDAEMAYRQIFMDGRKLEEPMLLTWGGYSVGHWDGDTLVVESNGFNDKTWLTRAGLPHSDQLLITERYQRTGFGNIELTITYQDPGAFKETLEAIVTLAYVADTEILEAACNESKTGTSHYSGEISQAEKKLIEVPESTLKEYIGTYEGPWLGNKIITEIVLEDGELFIIRTPDYSDTGDNVGSAKSKLVAQSEIAFDCDCGLGFIFEVNDEGVADTIYEVHVSGQWPFERVR